MLRELLLLSVAFFFAPAALAATMEQTPLVIQRTDGRKIHLQVEIARSDEQQALGLMHRTSVPKGTGMIFTQDQPSYPRMWMKDTLVPLDMIFFDAHGVVVYIDPNAQPNDLTPRGPETPSCLSLEVSGGQAAAQGITEGARLVSYPKDLGCLP